MDRWTRFGGLEGPERHSISGHSYRSVGCFFALWLVPFVFCFFVCFFFLSSCDVKIYLTVTCASYLHFLIQTAEFFFGCTWKIQWTWSINLKNCCESFNSIGFMKLMILCFLFYCNYLIILYFQVPEFHVHDAFLSFPSPLHFRSCIALDLIRQYIPRGLKQLPVQVKRPGKPRWWMWWRVGIWWKVKASLFFQGDWCIYIRNEIWNSYRLLKKHMFF